MSDLIEYNVLRSLVATLSAASVVTAPIQEQGVRAPAAGIEEWVCFDLIEIPRRRNRQNVYLAKAFFQIGCYI